MKYMKKKNRKLHISACSRFCEALENLVEVENLLWNKLIGSLNGLSSDKSKFQSNVIVS